MQNKEQFTPKPWFAVDYCGYMNIQSTEFYEEGNNLLDAEHFNEYEANGTLAAAAPDMYEALKEMLDLNFYEGRDANIYFHVGMNESRPQLSTTLQYIFKKMQAAISKANPQVQEDKNQ